MKKIIYYCTICFVGLLVASLCSSCNKPIANIILNDDLEYVVDVYHGESDFFEPVAGVYPVVEKDGKLRVEIEFVKTKKTSNKNYEVEEFVLCPTDKDERDIEIDGKDVEFHAEDRNAVVQNLLNANIGDKVKVVFEYIPADKQAKKTLAEKIYSCEVDLTLDEPEEMEDAEDTYDDEEEIAESSEMSSTNWDQVMDEYESYVNQYIALMKKAQKGDMSAMSEYTKMLEKAESFSTKLESANDKMTSAQISRYMKITNKMAQAAY